MLTPIAPHHPIAPLFKQLEDGQKFAASDSAPFTNDQLIMYTEQLILETGQYSNMYRTWMATPVPKTYQMVKTHFTAKYQLLNRMKHTTSVADYHQINFAAEDALDTAGDETASLQLNKTATQFAAANAQGQQTMAQLAATNAQLRHQVQELQQQTQMNTQMMIMAVTNNNSNTTNLWQNNHGGRGGGQGGRDNQ
eukprot:5133301-Ditylum_brightwellii.AAC.1